MKWRPALRHINAIDFAVQIALVVLAVIAVGISRLVTR